MTAKLLRDRIKLPSPKDWRPSVGMWVIIPARHSGRAWSGFVEAVSEDMFDAVVRVRVPRFKNSHQIWRVSDVRPHPWVYGDDEDSLEDDMPVEKGSVDPDTVSNMGTIPVHRSDDGVWMVTNWPREVSASRHIAESAMLASGLDPADFRQRDKLIVAIGGLVNGMIEYEHSRAAVLLDAIKAGGWDISPCGRCGNPVVCLPDGLPMCETCAEKESNG